jgi:hypothetical protein
MGAGAIAAGRLSGLCADAMPTKSNVPARAQIAGARVETFVDVITAFPDFSHALTATRAKMSLGVRIAKSDVAGRCDRATFI